MRRCWATAAMFVCSLESSAAAAAPEQLRGKSVVVTWSEARIQRHVEEANFRQVNASHNLSVYVSAVGRVFNRLTNTTRAGSGATEQVAGSEGARRVPSFSGRSMDLYAPFRSGGMRHVVVEFDAAFGSCSATVTYAKPPGTTISVAYSPITKKFVEFQSLTPGAASCSISSGNVFGEN